MSQWPISQKKITVLQFTNTKIVCQDIKVQDVYSSICHEMTFKTLKSLKGHIIQRLKIKQTALENTVG